MAVVPFDSARMSGYRERSKAFAAGFTPGQKAMVAVAAVGLVVASVLFYRAESKPRYGVLFSGLSAKDAGAVTAALGSAHVPFQVSGGGSTVLVPKAQVDTERVALAQKGLPSGGTVGFSALAKTGITTSQFVQQVDYQQALEGQLVSTIESIKGVQAAKVSLAIPQQSPFALGTGPSPTASILVALAPGATLSSSQVQAIVHLSASSVPGLHASAVTVVDNHGDVLSAPGMSVAASQQQQQAQSYDTAVGGAIQAMLDKVVGPGNSAVQVHATLNFNKVKTTSQSVQANAKGAPLLAPTSQSATKETFSGTAAPASGVLGANQPALNQNGNGNYTKTKTATTNAVGQVTQVVTQAPGSVQAASVAVLLNSKAAKAISAAQVTSLVRAAAGLTPAQTGAISVAAVPFSTAASSQAAVAAKSAAAASRSALRKHEEEVGGLVLALVVLFALALRTARRRRPSYEEIPLSELPSAQMASSTTEVLPAAVTGPPTVELAALGAPIEGELDRFIDENPDEVARLLRNWASERRRPERSGA